MHDVVLFGQRFSQLDLVVIEEVGVGDDDDGYGYS